jgi:hypothetical protein
LIRISARRLARRSEPDAGHQSRRSLGRRARLIDRLVLTPDTAAAQRAIPTLYAAYLRAAGGAVARRLRNAQTERGLLCRHGRASIVTM